MSARPIRSTPAISAKNSRRAALRAYAWRRERRRSWIRPFRRTRRAIDVTLRLIESSCRAIDACERLAAEHPIRATRQFEQVSGWLCEASEQLGRGAREWSATFDNIERAPFFAGDAPRLLTLAMVRWVDAATKLATLSNRLDDSFTSLMDYVKGGTAPLDLSELVRKPAPAPRRISFTVRRPSLKFLSRENSRVFCIHVRRQRSARLTVAEAPRRIFRGRAPPFVSTCPL
ncbi:MAG: hypothetical protein QOE82_1170 [Thermoanaerobaculia bacterium]|jgi:hypothetical protein|nr:hypothetical protein [Thermoanaerobaculia bacterium]